MEQQQRTTAPPGHIFPLYSDEADRLPRMAAGRAHVFAEDDEVFMAVFQHATSAFLLMDERWRILNANQKCLQLFNAPEGLIGRSFHALLESGGSGSVERFTRGLTAGRVRTREFTGLADGGGRLPIEVTGRRVRTGTGPFYFCAVRDLTLRKRFKENLRQEKRQVRDMSVTLKNVIKSVDEEKKVLKDNIAQTLEIEVLPALDKMSREPSREIRDIYKKAIWNQLVDLTTGSSKRPDHILLKLTATEIDVCRHIQNGNSTKEIADLVNSAFETIQTHRKNIRRKLGLRGKKMALQSFLRNHGAIAP
jgi:PAS domain S-box-containing protein